MGMYTIYVMFVHITNYATKIQSHNQNPVTYYVTGFWKTDRIVTLGLFHFIGPAIANGYTCTLYTYTVQLPGLVDWSAFLERVLPTL